MRHLILGTTLLLALTACGGGDDSAEDEGGSASRTSESTSSEAPTPRFENAYAICEGVVKGAIDFEADPADFISYSAPSSIIVTTPPPSDGENLLVSLDAAKCVLNYLDAPASINANIESTTGLMGRQSATHDGVNIQWSFSGGDDGNGLDVTFDDSEAGE